MHDVGEQLRSVFDQVQVRGYVHFREIGSDVSVGLDADAPVVVASVIKILLLVAFARAVDDGLDPAQRTEVPAPYRVGGSGTAGCVDPVAMSMRDLAGSMMSVSDNAATDVLLDVVGLAAVNAVADDLGLANTHMRGGMVWGARGVAAELGLPGIDDLDGQLLGYGGRVRGLAWLDPARANCSTAREVSALLEAIWTDAAASPAACAFMREAMSHQVSQQRLRSGFPGDATTVASKTGTLPTIRNEAGVVTGPDGRRFVAAVFTRAESLEDHRPDVDAAIGQAARLAVEALRAAR